MANPPPLIHGRATTTSAFSVWSNFREYERATGTAAARGNNAVWSYAFSPDIKTIVFDAVTITNTDNSTFRLPEIKMVGFTDWQVATVDKFIAAMRDRIRTDPAFRNSRAMQSLKETLGESYIMLNGANELAGNVLPKPGQTLGFPEGVTLGLDAADPPSGPFNPNDPTTNPAPDKVVEIVINTGDKDMIADPKLGNKQTQIDFLNRVVHEWMHKLYHHTVTRFDGTKTLLENVNAPRATWNDIVAVDLAYGGAPELIKALASDSRLNYSASQIDALQKEYAEGEAKALNWRTEADMLVRFEAIKTDPARTLDRPTLDALVNAKLIEFDKSKLPPNATAAQIEAAKNIEANYNVSAKKLGEFPASIKEYMDSVDKKLQKGEIQNLDGAVNETMGFISSFFAEYASEIGQILGSTLGRQIFRDSNVATQITASTFIGTLGMNIGEEIELNLRKVGDPDAPTGFDNFDEDLLNAGIGALSSFLTAELFEDMGLEGPLAELGQSVFANQLTVIVDAIRQGKDISDSLTAASNIASLAQVVGGFIGTKLAQEFVEFDTVEGQIGAAMGSAFGAIAGAKIGLKLGAEFGFWGAVIGAFVGFIAGGVIGTFFATSPRSGADVVWNEKTQKFGAGKAWARGNAPKEGATAISSHVAELLNSMVLATGARVVDGWLMKLGSFGTYESNFVFRTTDASGKAITPIVSAEMNLVVNFGMIFATAQLLPRLAGGNVYIKRAIAGTLALANIDLNAMPVLQHGRAVYTGNYPRLAHSNRQYDLDMQALGRRFDANVLLGNMSTAADYAAYLADSRRIDFILAAEPDSAFASGWAITFARAYELGLTKRSFTDWIGGWNAYLDELNDGLMNGNAFTGAALMAGLGDDKERLIAVRDNEQILGVDGDTIDTRSKDIINGTAGADAITVNSNNRIASTTGLTINGAAASGAEFRVDVAAAISGLGGNDTIRAGDLGNDLIGGDGNDTLVGGKLDDWLFGDAGADRLFAGAPAAITFADTDAAAVAAAINTNSNGDMLNGGDGNDLLYGSKGSDWLQGGAGTDTLRGGLGGDIIDGGAGDDRASNGDPLLLGGGGTDQYVFGYGSGRDAIFDDADNAYAAPSGGDSLYARMQSLNNGTLLPDWAGGGAYEIDGSVRGGEDSVSFGPGVGLQDLILRRSGTSTAPGQDLIIQLTAVNPTTGVRTPTGDQLEIKDWFEPAHRVEWLRFMNGEEVRLGSIASFTVGTALSDVIVGTNEADFLYGGDGNDSIFGLAGDDFGFGGGGNDMVAGDEDNDLVSGGSGNDSVIGGLGNDTVLGDAGDDRLNGSDGSDVMVGGEGDDEVIGGAGNDIFIYERGDGRDTLIDSLADNWELVWQNGVYVNGYVLNGTTGTVTKNGVEYFNGSQWTGVFDYNDAARTLRRNTAPTAVNAGTDYLQFGVGIDIQDLMLSRAGNDLVIAVQPSNVDLPIFALAEDRIAIRDWYTTGNTIENFSFVATGNYSLTGVTLAGGTDGVDTLTGTATDDWITGNAGDDLISGAAGKDILAGNDGHDNLRGQAGNDVLYGGAGDDVLEGGAGADVLIGGDGSDIASYANSVSPGNQVRAFLGASWSNSRDAAGDTFNSIEGLEGSGAADRLGGDASANVLRGLAGNDNLFGGAGDDIYEFEPTNNLDVIYDAPFTTEEIISSAGVLNTAQYTATWAFIGEVNSGANFGYRLTVTRNGTGEEVYRSRDGIDYIYALRTSTTRPMPAPSTWPSANGQWNAALGVTRTGNNVTPGSTNGPQTVREIFNTTQDGGIDTIEFGTAIALSDLTFAWQPGNTDLRINYSSSHYVTITGQSVANTAIEVLTFRDGLTADLSRLVMPGSVASEGGDLVVGDANANTLEGLGGDDVISGAAGVDILRGGAGDDILEGGASGDTLDGGTDSQTDGQVVDITDPLSYGDTIRYVRSTAAVNINLATRVVSGGHAASDVIVAVNNVSTIENVVGSEGYGDTLRGDARANRLSGLGGDDTLEGNAGNDVLIGGTGNDTLRGGDGDDNIAGETGNDTIEGGNDKDLLAGGEGNDILSGDAGDDILSGADGDDILRGGADNDTIGGETGADQLYGDAGNDDLAGGEGNDSLFGGDGDDDLFGELGDDQLSGDAGDDTYVFDANSGVDTIVDASGTNRIVINDVDTQQVWITRSGNDLRIGVIGGSSIVTVLGYYAAATPSRMASIVVGDHTLDLLIAAPLIQQMTAISVGTPMAMPDSLVELDDAHWNGEVTAGPVVNNQVLTTAEDTALVGAVNATDLDNNITGYALGTAPTRGAVNLNATAGTWTYTPTANAFGADTFTIVVTDADGNTATQSVNLTITSVNDAPTAINVSGLVTSINERDRPITGSTSPAIVLATLSVTDPDVGDTGDFATHAYTVSDSRFEVVGGQLRLKAGSALDYETATSVTFNVTATDRNGAGLSVTRSFTFAVNNRDDYFYGTTGNDTITGTAGANLIYGQGGNDTLNGAGANDLLDGGDGNDTLNGLGGIDTLYGQIGDDILDGGVGDDTLRGGDGIDTLRGGDGIDQLYGDGGNDLLQGGIGNDTLEGGTNDDQLEGGDGNDTLRGGDGNDTLIGGLGADRFNGGLGSDTVSYAGAAAGVTLSLTAGTGTVGEASGDVFEDTPERLIGSAFADSLTGSSGIDYIEGGAGNDTLVGGAGDDQLFGGDGNDTLDAQAGDDYLDGGLGSDILIGGLDNDTYILNANSGTDEIRNFDATGTEVDVIGYQGIANAYLWFEKSGNDLIVTAVGTTTRTTIKDWYTTTNLVDRQNYKIDFFVAGAWAAKTINAEALVTLMAGYTRPTTAAAYDTLHANSTFESGWSVGWNLNQAPTLGSIGTQVVNEDGSLSFALTINDDITPRAGLVVTAQAVNASTNAADTSIISNPTLTMDGAGVRTIRINPQPNVSGQAAVRVTVTDAGGLTISQVFLVNVTPDADAPGLSGPTWPGPVAPSTRNSFDAGSIPITLDAWLTDTDGSETLDIRISNVVSGLSFNQGSNLGGGVWSFTRAQLSGLRLQAAADYAAAVSLNVSVTSRETANGDSETRTGTIAFDVNARPTDIYADRTLSFAENTAVGSGLAWFGRTDPDGDAVTYELLNNANGRFALRSDGWFSVGPSGVDFEGAGPNYVVTVRITDPDGLSRTEDFTVNITNVNEAPDSLNVDRTLSFDEGLGNGYGLAWFSSTDPDAGATATYSIVDSAGGRYAVRSDGLLMAGATPTDYESGATSFNIVVRVSDGSLSYDRTFTVGVRNVNEAPSISSSAFTVPESNPGAGAYLIQTGGGNARVTGTDPEGATLKYTLAGGDTNVFSIDEGGFLHLQGSLNYEGPTRNYSVIARAWDGGAINTGNYVDQTISIAVSDIAESPSITGWLPDPNTTAYDSFIGTIQAVDPDGGPLTYEILYSYNHVEEGNWELGSGGWNYYDEDAFVTVDSTGRVSWPGFPFEQYGDGWYRHEKYAYSGYFVAQARDASGLVTGQMQVNFTKSTSVRAPVVFDLDGDGAELVSMDDSTSQFAMDDSAPTIRTSWVAADDAMLAIDRDGDGLISHGSEISFSGDLDFAASDLEGLAAFDTNGNLSLDAGDERFGEFLVWQDRNQDGVSQQDELRSLNQAGIESLSILRTLTGDPLNVAGSQITATTDFVRLDGSRGQASDVELTYESFSTEVTSVQIGPEAAEAGDIASVDRASNTPSNEPPRHHAPGTAEPDEPIIDPVTQPAAARSRPPTSGTRAPAWDRWSRDRGSWQEPSQDEQDEWVPAAAVVAGALHSSLSTLQSRRLQMIDAMAGFDRGEGAAELALRPQRHVDSRTLELLTTVPRTASMR